MAYKYKILRVVCEGTIKTCEFCKDIPVPSEGYCKCCRRPLWRNPGERCSSIVGYIDGELKRYMDSELKKQGKKRSGINFICKECNSITSI